MKKFLFLSLLLSLAACQMQAVKPTELEQNSEARVSSPSAHAFVSSPLSVDGSAPGTWFSEGVLSVHLEDANGTVLAQTSGVAEGDWMTIERVPFHAELEFAPPTTTDGVLVIENDNPSGLAENMKRLEVPVVF